LDNNVFTYVTQILGTLDINLNVKEGFEHIFELITEEIKKLKNCYDLNLTQLSQQQNMINNLQKRLDEIESSSLLKEIQVDAFEISKLFFLCY